MEEAKPEKRSPFCRIPWAIVDARPGPYALAVYAVLARHANKSGTCFPSLRHIADDAGIKNVRTVRKAIGQLRKLGLIEVKPRLRDREHISHEYLLGGVSGDLPRSLNDLPSASGARGGGSLDTKEVEQPLLTRTSNKGNTHSASRSARALPLSPEPPDHVLEPIFAAYPRRVKHRAALTAIRSAINRLEAGENGGEEMDIHDAIDFLRARIELFATSPKGRGGRWTPYPTTFFSESRYLDNKQEWWGEILEPEPTSKHIFEAFDVRITGGSESVKKCWNCGNPEPCNRESCIAENHAIQERTHANV